MLKRETVIVNPLINRIYETECVEDAEGNRINPFPTSIAYDRGLALYHLIRTARAHATLEIGMAYGLSTLFICQALCDNGGGSHTVIDPLQQAEWRSIGLLNLERAGLDQFLRFIEAGSEQALPQLYLAGEQVDVVFIDGGHQFDTVFLDFYYADKLLRAGGYLMFDDVWMPAVRKVCSFIGRNRQYALAPEFLGTPPPLWQRGMRMARCIVQDPLDVHSLHSTARMLVKGFVDYCILQKVADDARPWNHYKPF